MSSTPDSSARTSAEPSFPLSDSRESVQSGISTVGPLTPPSLEPIAGEDAAGVRTRTYSVESDDQMMSSAAGLGGPGQKGLGLGMRSTSPVSFSFPLQPPTSSTNHLNLANTINPTTTTSSSSNTSSVSSMTGSTDKRPSYGDDPYRSHPSYNLPPPSNPYFSSSNTNNLNISPSQNGGSTDYRDLKHHTPPGSIPNTPIDDEEKRAMSTSLRGTLSGPTIKTSAALAAATGGSNPLTGAGEGEGTKKWTDSAAYWLILYFMFNLGLTLFNKIVLVNFPFPYTLTGLHALSGCAGCYIALERGAFVPARLTSKENLVMGAFSVLYTINIAVSNLSLHLVTVPFHQVVRASTPLFTILISVLFFRGKFSVMKLVSLLPVIAGVGFATYGDYHFTAWGLILTLLGTFLAAMKTVITNVIQTGGGGRLKLHPLDLLMRMSPLAFIQCVVYGWWSGELERVRRYGATEMTREKAFALLVNGMIAFGLNIVSFSANKKTGALTMTVAANCKQVLTIAIAVFLFNLHINFTNGIGILLTLIGGGWYGFIEFQEKNNKARLNRLTKGP